VTPREIRALLDTLKVAEGEADAQRLKNMKAGASGSASYYCGRRDMASWLVDLITRRVETLSA